MIQHPGKLIKGLAGVNIYDIAKHLQVHPVTSGKLVNGKIKITGGMAEKIAEMMCFFSVEPKEFQTTEHWLEMNDKYYEHMKESKQLTTERSDRNV